MDSARLGSGFRALRIKKRLRQEDAAARAHVPRSVVSKLERGFVGELRVDHVIRIADALGGRLELIVRWQGGDLDRLINARHSSMHESVARWFARWLDWEFAPEVSFSIR